MRCSDEIRRTNDYAREAPNDVWTDKRGQTLNGRYVPHSQPGSARVLSPRRSPDESAGNQPATTSSSTHSSPTTTIASSSATATPEQRPAVSDSQRHVAGSDSPIVYLPQHHGLCSLAIVTH